MQTGGKEERGGPGERAKIIAERDDGRGVNRKSFGAEEAPSAHGADSRLRGEEARRSWKKPARGAEPRGGGERGEAENRKRAHSSRAGEAGAGLKRSV